VIAFVSKSEADCRTLREVAAPMSQPVISIPDLQQARRALHRLNPEIVLCDADAWASGSWQELLQDAQEAESLFLVASRQADERLSAEVLNLGGFDVLTSPFDRDELCWTLLSAIRHVPRASSAAVAV